MVVNSGLILKKMSCCPLGAKTWVGQFEFFSYLPLWADMFKFLALIHIFSYLKKRLKKKKCVKKPTVDFKIFCVGRNGPYNIFFCYALSRAVCGVIAKKRIIYIYFDIASAKASFGVAASYANQ